MVLSQLLLGLPHNERRLRLAHSHRGFKPGTPLLTNKATGHFFLFDNAFVDSPNCTDEVETWKKRTNEMDTFIVVNEGNDVLTEISKSPHN